MPVANKEEDEPNADESADASLAGDNISWQWQLVERELGAGGPPGASEIILQVLSALEAAHKLGVVHRDVEPGNNLPRRGA